MPGQPVSRCAGRYTHIDMLYIVCMCVHMTQAVSKQTTMHGIDSKPGQGLSAEACFQLARHD